MRHIHTAGSEGIPLDSVIEGGVGGQVVAYLEGGTFSEEGLKRLPPVGMYQFTARLLNETETGGYQVEVRAVDVAAALMCLWNKYSGQIDLWIDPHPVCLGEFSLVG